MSENLLQLVRKYVFDHFLEHAQAPVLEEIMQKFGLRRTEAHLVLKELEAARHVVLLPGTQRILMANPFSSLTTPFKVTIDGKVYYGACAWDAVAFHVTLGADTSIDSFCHHCAGRIRIHLSRGGIKSMEPKEPLVFISVPAAKWWNNIVNTCSNNMIFLSSRDHLDEWLGANPGLIGEALTIEKTLEVSMPLYKDKMKLEYRRPAKDELAGYLDSIGLRGDFWKL